MSKYSFLLQGEEPSYFELLPGLRLRKYGGWLVAESIEQEETSRAQSQSTIRAVQLAKKIAVTKGIALEEAFDMLQGGASLNEMDLLGEFTEETLGMLTSVGSVELSNARVVTTFIRCRGEAMIDGEWQRVDDWSIDDTKTMGRKLIAKTMEFINEEQQAEIEEAGMVKKERKTRTVAPSKS
jgi:hypothetical protein